MKKKVENFYLILLILKGIFYLVLSTKDDEFACNFNNESYKQSEQVNMVRELLSEDSFCNIPIENEPISQEEFIHKYAYKSPVVFRRGKSNSLRNMIFKEKCQFSNLIKEYGQKKITVSTANTHSYRKYSMLLNDYLDKYVLSSLNKNSDGEIMPNIKYGNETWYFFGENNYTEWKDLLDLYERPPYKLPDHEHAYSFGIASALTGVPFHFHGPVFAETMIGRKRWFLYEPSKKPKFNPDKSALHWYLEDYKHLKAEDKPFECVLEPLDIIYFPNLWWHQTLNIDTVVFISTFLSPILKV